MKTESEVIAEQAAEIARLRSLIGKIKAEYDHLPPESKALVPTFENFLALNYPERCMEWDSIEHPPTKKERLDEYRKYKWEEGK